MALEQKHKWIIVIFAILILLVIAYFIWKAIPSESGGGAPPVSTTVTNPGLIGAVSGVFCKAFPKLCGLAGGGGNYQTTGCDPDRPGYNTDGLYDNNCQS